MAHRQAMIQTAAAVALVFGGNLVQASIDPRDFTYSQAIHLDLSSSDAETTVEEDAVVESELLYGVNDDNIDSVSTDTDHPANHYLVSSRTFMDERRSESSSSSSAPLEGSVFHVEGATFLDSTSSLSDDNSSVSNNNNNDSFGDFESWYENLDSDDEDDNDDDNDGHSSMLSNASLGGGKKRIPDVSIRMDTALQMRGGAAVSASTTIFSLLHSDMSKKLFVSALVTLIFEACIGHVLEFLKIVQQTSTARTPDSYATVIRSITQKKGVAGLWDGFCPWGIVQATLKGAVFGVAHAGASNVLVPAAQNGKIPLAVALTMAGGIGGGFQGYVLSPTLLLKTRVMTNPVFRESMSLWKTTVLSFRIGYDVVAREGLATLMKGSNVFATKRVFDWASRYFFADLFEALFTMLKNGQSLSVYEKSVASLLGGVASTCVTLPLDVLVAKTQDAKKAGVQVSALTLFREELKEKGVQGLRRAYMRGFEARLLHVCLTTLVIKTGTPIAYKALFPNK